VLHKFPPTGIHRRLTGGCSESALSLKKEQLHVSPSLSGKDDPMNISSFIQEICYILGGLIWGSFLGVLADRIPRGESILTPPSHCLTCQKRLSPLDLIPLWAWVGNKGVCRYCGATIDPQMLGSEMLSGLFFGILPFISKDFRNGIVLATFFSFALPLSLIDLRHRRLPHSLTWTAGFSGLLLAWSGPERFFYPIGGFLAGFITLGLVSILHPKGMGMGDAFWIGSIGTFVGATGVVETLFLSSFFAILSLLPLFLVKKPDSSGVPWYKTSLPFGPYLSLGAILVLVDPGHMLEALQSAASLNNS
jgi:leader peptidase (prepilin peptidase)/N-methyltransferase